MPEEQTKVPISVYAALLANVLIAAAKYVVAFLTGSSAMLSEAIHSTADTGNELLLLLGLRRSRKPPDDEHPLGHGRELYFWSLIVATMLFSTGAGSALYEGLMHLGGKGEIQNAIWNYAVLAFSLLVDGISWIVSIRQLRKGRRPGESFWANLKTSKDPSDFLVFGEDTAGVVGILVAFAGIFISQQLHSHLPDVIASMLVGVILAAVAVFLAYESKSLLIGESADQELVNAVQKLVSDHPAVARSRRPLSVHLSPREVFLCIDVQFRPELRADDLVKVVDELEHRIHEQQPSVGQIFIEIERLKEYEKEQIKGAA